jgi:hypothetical protein
MPKWTLILLAFFLLVPALPGRAQDGPINNTATVDYPQSITFRLELPADTTITEAVLQFRAVQRSCVDVRTSVPIAVENGIAEWTWPMVRSGNPPPGAVVEWQWTYGDDQATPVQSITLQDTRFDWRIVEDERVRVHWYAGDRVGPALLSAATAGLDQLESTMGIMLDGQVDFYIYEDAADMRAAVLYIQDWAGGVAFNEYNTILMGVPPAIVESWGRPTVRHELAHLVVDQFADGCLGGRRPNWLDEGLATVAEGPANEDIRADLAAGIEEDSFVPLRSLNGAFPAHDSGASMAYSQSYSVVDFLLSTYGPEPIQQLLLLLAGGKGYDEALEAVYGVNTDGLETAWRAAIGAQPRTPLPTPTAVSAASIPTVPPLNSARPVPTPANQPAGPANIEAPTAPLCGLAAMPLLILGFSSRRRRS